MPDMVATGKVGVIQHIRTAYPEQKENRIEEIAIEGKSVTKTFTQFKKDIEIKTNMFEDKSFTKCLKCSVNT